MIYTKLTKTAMKLCFEKHKDQMDKSGLPYVFHPYQVAQSMTDEWTTCTALLHDILEDTDVTAEQLGEMGFPAEVVDAITLMSHDPSIPYLDYVRQIKTNPIAKAVKIADLKHNSDLSRLDEITQWDLQRAEKYAKALDILLEE